jgi:hypothetical protein
MWTSITGARHALPGAVGAEVVSGAERRIECGVKPGEVDRPAQLLGDEIDQRAQHLEGGEDLPADLPTCRAGRIASTDTRMPRWWYHATIDIASISRRAP